MYTNAVFAEKDNIAIDKLNLSNKKLSNICIEKIHKILEMGIGSTSEMDDLKNDLNLRDDFVDYHLREDKFTRDEIRKVMNGYLVVNNFYSWAKDLDILKKDGGHVINSISVGDDRWHISERIKKDFTINVILHERIRKCLQKSISPIEFDFTQGTYPAYIGRAHKFKSFSKKDPVMQERKRFKRSRLVSDGRKLKGETIFASDNYEGLMNFLYKTNWDNVPKSDSELKFFNSRFRICGCITKNSLLIAPSGEIHGCTYGVLPPAKTALGGKINNEYLDVEKAFHKNGGPFGVARYYGMSEDKIYSTFMDKGPCGLCQSAVNSGRKDSL